MPCVKWGIGTRYCRSFQRRHSICPIRVSCITGSPVVESGQMESNWIVSNRFRQRNVRVAARFSSSIHSVFRVVVVSLFHKRGEGRGARSIITCKRWPRRSITCRKYLGQGSQGRFPRVQSYRVRLHADVQSFWNRLLLISCDSF